MLTLTAVSCFVSILGFSSHWRYHICNNLAILVYPLPSSGEFRCPRDVFLAITMPPLDLGLDISNQRATSHTSTLPVLDLESLIFSSRALPHVSTFSSGSKFQRAARATSRDVSPLRTASSQLTLRHTPSIQVDNHLLKN
jgi:hypothetical protein